MSFDACQSQVFPVNDNQDADGDFNICETFAILEKTASYENPDGCDLSAIQWIVTVDLDNDGSVDLEYSSAFSPSDSTLDDTNGNGINDKYLPPTTNGELQQIHLPEIDGNFSTHKVVWKVLDDCDNGAICSTNITVQDMSAPTPFCVSLSTIIFEPFIEIHAQDFFVGVFDNCTENENLEYSFSPDEIIPSREITCADAENSPIEVPIYVFDEIGNNELCIVLIQVINQAVDCLETTRLEGNVSSWKSGPIEGAEVIIDAEAPEFPRSVFTDENGDYVLNNLLKNFNYTVYVKKPESIQTGVSTLDLVLAQRHMLGLQTFDNPYKTLASDINTSSSLTVSDLLLFRKIVFGLIQDSEEYRTWDFLDASYQVDDVFDPWPIPESARKVPIFIADVPGDLDFIAIKKGDVND